MNAKEPTWRSETKFPNNLVQKIRKIAKWPQSAFARHLGVSLSLITSVESGRRTISEDMILRLKQRCGVVIRNGRVFDLQGNPFCKRSFDEHLAKRKEPEIPFITKDFAGAVEMIGAAAERAGLVDRAHLILYIDLKKIVRILKLAGKLEAATKEAVQKPSTERVGYLVRSLSTLDKHDPLLAGARNVQDFVYGQLRMSRYKRLRRNIRAREKRKK